MIPLTLNARPATRDYELWMRSHIPVVERDLRQKHATMKAGFFPFFRGTYYLWARNWQAWAPAATKAPVVLAVGDLHVENFGTWRDCEGRLVWGVNDFDEAWHLPYTADLLRLAASALVAARENHLAIRARQTCAAIWQGYCDGIRSGGETFVLGERHTALRTLAESRQRDPKVFWARIDGLLERRGTAGRKCPASARKAIEHAMPAPKLTTHLAPRVAGVGSLGRERWVGVARYAGGRVAREAKAVLPSAHAWVEGRKDPPILYREIVANAVRCPDPFLHVGSEWLVRRLSPSNSRIELTQLPRKRDEHQILYSMGFETANIHLGTGKAMRAVRKDLDARPESWLRNEAKLVVRLLAEQWRQLAGTQ